MSDENVAADGQEETGRSGDQRRSGRRAARERLATGMLVRWTRACARVRRRAAGAGAGRIVSRRPDETARRVNISRAPFEYDPQDPEGFRSGAFRLAPVVGGVRLGATVYELPPGESICPYHYEYGEEEWLLVLEGRPTLRRAAGVDVLDPWDVACFPSGPEGAHSVGNERDETARVLMVSTVSHPAATVYPDSDKIAIWTGNPVDDVIVPRGSAVGYWAGEDREGRTRGADERGGANGSRRRVRLEPLSQEHVAALEALALDPEVRRHTPVRARPPVGFASAFVEGYERGRADGTREAFAVVGADDGAFLGVAAALRLEDVTSEAELACVLAPEARARGVAADGLTLLTDWGFARGLHRLELRISADDADSQRAAERCGYVREGRLRSVHFNGGRRSDMLVYSRLASEE